MSKQTEKTLHVQTEILRKKLIKHLNNNSSDKESVDVSSIIHTCLIF